MLVFEVSDNAGLSKKFNAPESISEITLGEFIKFQETIHAEKPKTLVGYEAIDDEAERLKFISTVSDEEIVVKWTEYYVRFVQYFTKLPDKYALNLEREQVSWLYKLISLSILTHTYNEEKDSFTHKGQTYFYPPAPLSPLNLKKQYLKGSRVIDVIEAFQYEKFSKQLSVSQWGVLPYLIAILCKKENEQLPLKTTERELWLAERKQEFETLPLSDAFDVGFFLTKQKVISENLSPLYSLLQLRKHLTKKKKFGKHTVGIPR